MPRFPEDFYRLINSLDLVHCDVDDPLLVKAREIAGIEKWKFKPSEVKMFRDFAERERFKRAVEQGLTDKEIAKKYHLSRRSVCYRRSILGLGKSNHKKYCACHEGKFYVATNKEQLFKMMNKKMTFKPEFYEVFYSNSDFVGTMDGVEFRKA